MNKSTLFFGIDISKDSFDVYNDKMGYTSYSNSKDGFKTFLKVLNRTSHCVMEATGCYHHKLAMFLYEKGIIVSVVNPLVIKRFIQMKLRRLKTDKSDAFMIYSYASEQSVEEWQPEKAYIERGKELLSLIQTYLRQATALKNKLHALESKGQTKGVIISSMKRQLRNLQSERQLLEQELESLIKTHESKLFTRLTSIPGIGKKTAVLMMVSTSNFNRFNSYKQVSSYLGLAPNERSSGSSLEENRE